MFSPALWAALSPDGDEARRWAEDELRQAKYSDPGPSLIERLGLWILDLLERLNLSFGGDATWTGSIAVVLLVAILAASAIVYGRLRSGGRAAGAGSGVILDDNRSVAQLLRDAGRAHGAGDFATACVDYYRACIRILDSRGLLAASPGMTARESAVLGEAATGLPLGPGARIFDAVLYGGADASAAEAEMMAGLVDRCRAGVPA